MENIIIHSSSPKYSFFFPILTGIHAYHTKQWDTAQEQALAQCLRDRCQATHVQHAFEELVIAGQSTVLAFS